jgi:hypothetical protein
VTRSSVGEIKTQTAPWKPPAFGKTAARNGGQEAAQ